MKKNQIAILLFIFGCAGLSQAQINVNREWQSSSGTPFVNPLSSITTLEWTASVTDGSGNVYTVGHTAVPGQGENLYLSKHKWDGTLLFERNKNTSGSNNDYATAVTLDGSGNIIVCGATDNGGTTNYDALLYIFNSTGADVDSTVYIGSSGLNDIATDVKTGPSGSILMLSASESTGTGYDYVIQKYSSGLSVAWTSVYDYAGLTDVPLGIDTDGSYVNITGASASALLQWDYAVAHFDLSTGAYVSDTRTNLPGIGYSQPFAFKKDAASNVYITGKGSTNGTDFDIFTVKINSSYVIDWTRTVDVANGEDVGNAIGFDNSGNIFVGGYTTNANNLKQMSILKYDASGTLLWQYNQGSVNGSSDAYVKDLCVTPTGDAYFIAGEEGTSGYQEVLVGKIGGGSNIAWERSIQSADNHVPSSVILNSDGTIYACSVKKSATPEYLTTKYSEFKPDTARVFNGGGRPVYNQKELIVGFWPSAIDKSAIDNQVGTKVMDFGGLSDFLTPTAYSAVSAGFETVCKSCDIKVSRIYKSLKTTDTLSVTELGDTIPVPEFWATLLLHLPSAITMNQALTVLNALPNEVAYTHPNYILLPTSAPNDSLYSFQKSFKTTPPDPLADINVEEAWSIYPDAGRADLKCGVFDTGVDWQHRDFGYVPGPNSITSGKVNGYDVTNDGDMRWTAIADSNGHGTGVAGIIGALRNNHMGVAGIAGGDSTITPGVSIISANTTFYSITKFIDVLSKVNLPYGGLEMSISNHSWETDSINFPAALIDTNFNAITEATHQYFRNQHTFVAARGNFATDFYVMPACMDSTWVISVSATDTSGQFKTLYSEGGALWGSGYGKGVDLAAPGVTALVKTTQPWVYSKYSVFNGTSAAAPHVTGAACVLMSYMRNAPTSIFLAPEDNEYILRKSATDINTAGWDKYTGMGRLNVGKAMRMVERPYRNFYQFKSSNTTHSHNVSVYSNSDTIYLTERYQNYEIPRKWFGKGNYIVKTFKVDVTANHSLGFVTDSIMYAWPRHSSTIGFGLFNASKNLTPHERLELNSCGPNSADMTFYIYQVKNMAGTPLGWWPCDTSLNSIYHNVNFYGYSLIAKNTAVGIHEKSKEHAQVSLFPNPANHQQTLVIETDKISNCTVDLYDLMGRYIKTVYKGKTGNGKTTIVNDVDKLPNSLYFYVIQLDENRFSKKFIKQE